MAKPKKRWEFRDVSIGLQFLREILLGRKHNLHGRFPPLLAPRSVPPPDIPRGPEYKYSKQYYCDRSVLDSVKPPVVAPIAEGPPVNQDPKMKAKPGGLKPNTLCFACAPTPGLPWGWDGHSYYDFVHEGPNPPCPSNPCSQPEPTQCPKP